MEEKFFKSDEDFMEVLKGLVEMGLAEEVLLENGEIGYQATALAYDCVYREAGRFN